MWLLSVHYRSRSNPLDPNINRFCFIESGWWPIGGKFWTVSLCIFFGFRTSSFGINELDILVCDVDDAIIYCFSWKVEKALFQFVIYFHFLIFGWLDWGQFLLSRLELDLFPKQLYFAWKSFFIQKCAIKCRHPHSISHLSVASAQNTFNYPH